ncbi:hypothetical protein MMC11_003844 [Xylographa trunciseda]|nr:hypothetical protein [Xylographa trunciseda]
MSQFDAVATISPFPAKFDRCVELLTAYGLSVQEHEFGCLRFHLHRRFNIALNGTSDPTEGKFSTDLINLETYVDRAALDRHVQTKAFKTLVKTLTEEKILREALVIRGAEPLAGFGSRLLGLQLAPQTAASKVDSGRVKKDKRGRHAQGLR